MCFVLCAIGYRRGLGEGEDAKEVWALVVLAEESRQHHQTGEGSEMWIKIAGQKSISAGL